MGQSQGALNQSAALCRPVPKYDWPTYTYAKNIGAGAFGEVYLVCHVTTKKAYALKKIKCGSNEDLNNVTEELKSMSKLEHPNIMKLHDTRCKQKEEFSAEMYMLLEYCPGGTLSDQLAKPYTKARNLAWMRQLTHAVYYIHALALVHRDLKPDNIMLDAKGNIKVGDFGLSRGFLAAKREDQSWASYYMSAMCGTLFYMAPEVFEGHYTEKADVFAMGVLLYAIWERECLEVNGVKCYAIFIRLSGEDRAPLGLQMYIDKTGLRVPFAKCDAKMAQIIGSTLLFDQKNRADACKVYDNLRKYV